MKEVEFSCWSSGKFTDICDSMLQIMSWPGQPAAVGSPEYVTGDGKCVGVQARRCRGGRSSQSGYAFDSSRGVEGDAVLDQVVARCDCAGIGVSKAGRFQVLGLKWLPESIMKRKDFSLPPVWEIVRMLAVNSARR